MFAEQAPILINMTRSRIVKSLVQGHSRRVKLRNKKKETLVKQEQHYKVIYVLAKQWNTALKQRRFVITMCSMLDLPRDCDCFNSVLRVVSEIRNEIRLLR